MSFDEILDLTADIFLFYDIFSADRVVHPTVPSKNVWAEHKPIFTFPDRVVHDIGNCGVGHVYVSVERRNGALSRLR